MLRLRPLLSLFLFCSLTLVPCAFAQTTLTQIQDTVYNSDGSLFNGTLVLTWTGTAPSTGSNPTPYNTSVQIVNGALSVSLVPSTTSPNSAPYTAIFTSSNGLTTWTETWQVPPASYPLTIAEVNVTNQTGSSQQVTISQVIGLTANLNAINGSLVSLTTTANGVSSQVATLSSSVATLTALVNGLSSGTISTAFSDAEVPGGTINGTNTTFTLANTPSPASTLALYRNGLLMTQGVDYSLSGSTVSFVSGETPQSGDVLQAYYRLAGSSTAPLFVDDQVPQGTINGTNLTFTLTSAPLPALSLKLYKNGDLLQQGTDYSLNGTTITFANTNVTPQPGDTLVAFYRTIS